MKNQSMTGNGTKTGSKGRSVNNQETFQTNTMKQLKSKKKRLWGMNVNNKDKKQLLAMFPHKCKEKQADTTRVWED